MLTLFVDIGIFTQSVTNSGLLDATFDNTFTYTANIEFLEDFEFSQENECEFSQ